MLLIRLASLQRWVRRNDAGFHFQSASCSQEDEEDKAETHEISAKDLYVKRKTQPSLKSPDFLHQAEMQQFKPCTSAMTCTKL